MTTTMQKAAAELIGTLLFVFAIVGAVNAGDFAALAIGFALMVLVYATGPISGGHLNPAVSFGALLRGAIDVKDFVVYVIAQLVGAVLGALLSMLIWAPAAEGMKLDIVPAFVAELVFTFALVFVVLNVATAKATAGNSYFGLAIGTTVFVGAVAVGAISGGGFNPAVALGLSVSGQFSWAFIWLYFLAPLVGAALAALAFRVVRPGEHKKDAAA